jgi:hypothetical protein
MLASKFMSIRPDSELTEKDKGRFQIFFAKVENKYSGFLKTAIRKKYVVFGVTVVLSPVRFTVHDLSIQSSRHKRKRMKSGSTFIPG